jgi:hypothetical protein
MEKVHKKNREGELYSTPGADFPSPSISVTASASHRDRIVLLEGHGVECDAHAGPFVRHHYLAQPLLQALCLRP